MASEQLSKTGDDIASIARSSFVLTVLLYLGFIIIQHFGVIIPLNYTRTLLMSSLLFGIISLFSKNSSPSASVIDGISILITSFATMLLGAFALVVSWEISPWSFLIGLTFIILSFPLQLVANSFPPLYPQNAFIQRAGALILAIVGVVAIIVSDFFVAGPFAYTVLLLCFFLFVPGFILSFLVTQALPLLHRIALGFALSMTLIPLIVLFLNRLGVPSTFLTVTLLVILTSLAGSGALVAKHALRKRRRLPQ